MHQPVRTVLSQKERGSKVHAIESGAKVIEAVHEMNEHRVGSLLVREQSEVVGIITERDVLVRVVAAGKNPDSTQVSSVMTPDPVTIKPNDTAGAVLALMTERRIRHLPVVDEGELLGLLSIGDFTRWIGRNQKGEIDDLVGYIRTA